MFASLVTYVLWFLMTATMLWIVIAGGTDKRVRGNGRSRGLLIDRANARRIESSGHNTRI